MTANCTSQLLSSRHAAPLGRRDVLRMGGLAAGLCAASPLAPIMPAWAAGARWWERIDAARAVVGNSRPVERGITLDLPSLSEDGSSVALTVAVDSPMTAADHVREIHLFATRNPSPEIAAIRLTPTLGRASVATRVRLGESQTVGAIARTAAGSVLVASRDIRITTSGCLMRVDAASEEMTPRVRVPDRFSHGRPAEVLTMLTHPMETGLRTNADGRALPQRIVQHFAATIDGEPVLEAELFRSVAANPYLRFFVAPRQAGTLAFVWVEDTGRRATAEAPFTVG